MVLSLTSFAEAMFDPIQQHPHLFMVLWIDALLLIERLCRAFPMQENSTGRRWLTGIVFGVINHGVLAPLMTLPLLVWAASLHLWSWPEVVPNWFTVALTVVVLDMAGYWFHRVSHSSQFLWRFHQVHHLDEEMDAMTGLRVHFVERLMQSSIASALVVALDLPMIGIVVHGLAGFAFATFHHSNFRLPSSLERVVGPVIITPDFHYPHHHAERRDTDSNYGFIFPWWDHLFGTNNNRRRTEDWRMGLEYSPDLNCSELIYEPFRRTPLWRRRRVVRKSKAPAQSQPVATVAQAVVSEQ